ncbi:TolC family protein [Spiribacter roseus]|uniref:TolC family protein n=1 Tax=Spiribacter roseus TaxID=1855875 RepID=A0ABV3S1C6_9GAMM
MTGRRQRPSFFALCFFVATLLAADRPSAASDMLADPDETAARLLDQQVWELTRAPVDPAFVERVRRAARKQPAVDAQRARVDELRAREREVGSARLPQIDLGLERRTDLESTSRTAFDNGNRVDAVANASQLLFDFGAVGRELDAAEYEVAAQRWQVQSALEQQITDLLSAHLDVIRAGALRALAIRHLAEQQRTVDRIRQQFEGGTITRAEVARAQARVERARARVVAAEGESERAAAVYRERFFETPREVEIPPLGEMPPSDLATALEQLRAMNSELQGASRASAAAAESAEAARRERLPRLSLDLQARRFDIAEDAADTDASLLFNLDYSLYTGGAGGARVDQARERRERARFERLALYRELERQLTAVYANRSALRREAAAQRLAMRAEARTVSAYEAQRQTGRSSFIGLIDARQDWFDARSRRVELVIETLKLSLEQRRLLGALRRQYQIMEAPIAQRQ